MPIERKKGKAEPKDMKAKQDSFDEANPHLAADAVSEMVIEASTGGAVEPDAAELKLTVPPIPSASEVVSLLPVEHQDPFVVVFESDMSSIYALQVGNGCIVKTIHADQVNVTFVPGAVLIASTDGRFKLKGRN